MAVLRVVLARSRDTAPEVNNIVNAAAARAWTEEKMLHELRKVRRAAMLANRHTSATVRQWMHAQVFFSALASVLAAGLASTAADTDRPRTLAHPE